MDEHGTQKYKLLKKAQIEKSLEKRKDTPHAQRHFHNAISKLCAWAKEEKYIDEDPRLIPQGRSKRSVKDAAATWTRDAKNRPQAIMGSLSHGTRERVWLDVLLYTGTRISDAVLLSDKLLNERGMISWDTVKTDTRVDMPVLKILRTTLDAGPTLPDAWIVGPSGRRLTSGRFGEAFVEAARAAGITKSAHGVRKAGACRAARAGATSFELMALFGWTSEKTATIYTRMAVREGMSQTAITKLERKAA